MDPSLSPAIREARAVCPNDVFEIETLEIFHPEVTLTLPNLQLSVVFDNTFSQGDALGTIKNLITEITARLSQTFNSVRYSLMTYSDVASTQFETGTGFVDSLTFNQAVDSIGVTGGNLEHVYNAVKRAADELLWNTQSNTVKACLLITEENNVPHAVTEQQAVDALNAKDIKFLLGFGNSSASWFPLLTAIEGFTHLNSFDTLTITDQLEAALQDFIVIPGAEPVYLTNDTRDHSLDDGTGEIRLFQSRGFGLRKSGDAKNGVQTLGITIDDTDRKVSRYLNQAKQYPTPVELKFRVYLSDNLENGPENDPPLVLYVSNFQNTNKGLSVNASTIDLINAPFPNRYYTLDKFPLG